MGLTQEDAVSLVTQVQQAHRLAVGFYQRILPALDNLAAHFDTRFWFWEPKDLSRPCPVKSRPSDSWSWDFTPLVCSRFSYIRSSGSEMQVSDFIIELQLLIDPAVTREYRGKRGQPDPTALEDVPPKLRTFLYWPAENSNEDLQEAYDNSPYPSEAEGQVENVGSNLLSTWFEIPLAVFVHDPQNVVARIAAFAPQTATTA